MWPMMMVLDLHPKLPDTVLPGPRRTLDDFGVTFRDDSDFGPTVAAVELVSLGNKAQASGRRAFLDKVVAHLRQGAGVCVVDVVTDHQHNFYADLLTTFEHTDSAFLSAPSGVYAASFRARERRVLEAWYHPLAVGEPLPVLPLWLSETVCVSLDLEASYEVACRGLNIR